MAKIEKVLCTMPLTEEDAERVRSAFGPAEITFCEPEDSSGIDAALKDADVAIVSGDIDDRFVQAPKLRWVHCGHSGLTKSARPEVFEKGLQVTGSAGRSAEALAQHGFYFALALTFDARGLFESQASHRWRGLNGYESRLSLAGKTLGIIGFGHTGREMASLGKAFRMNVVAYNRSARENEPNVDKMWCAEKGDTIDELVETSDVIMLATQLTDDTYHMISEAQFRQMKPSAYLINMARGGVIDEDAMIEALRQGQIAGAGLDVFKQEPLPESSPLWDIPNVVITPHQTPVLQDRGKRVIDTLVENARRYQAGESLLNSLKKGDVFTPR